MKLKFEKYNKLLQIMFQWRNHLAYNLYTYNIPQKYKEENVLKHDYQVLKSSQCDNAVGASSLMA